MSKENRSKRVLAKCGVAFSVCFIAFCVIGLLQLVDTNGVSPLALTLGACMAVLTLLMSLQRLLKDIP